MMPKDNAHKPLAGKRAKPMEILAQAVAVNIAGRNRTARAALASAQTAGERDPLGYQFLF